MITSLRQRRFRAAAWILVALAASLSILSGCKEEKGPLAPYQEETRLMKLSLFDTLFTPVLTWVGGYVAAVGVNQGSHAALDSTLVWLVQSDGNTIRYPVVIGNVPAGATERSGQYGGHPVSQLTEDQTYTYWMLKKDAWSVVSSHPGVPFFEDSSLTEVGVIRGDSLLLSSLSHVQRTKTLDVYISVYQVQTFGRLGTISIHHTNTSNDPIVSWHIIQTGVTDTLISVLGVGYGGSYNIDSRVWEVLSIDSLNGLPRYGKKNVIQSPVTIGEPLTGTRVFAEYPLRGLDRNRDYYLWIAQASWDGINRTRTTNYYAYATFRTR